MTQDGCTHVKLNPQRPKEGRAAEEMAQPMKNLLCKSEELTTGHQPCEKLGVPVGAGRVVRRDGHPGGH